MSKYQVMPDLSEDKYESLKQSIKKDGVKVPVIYDEEGNIIDGFNRVDICEELGIEDWPANIVSGLTEEEKEEYAYKLNCQRRHLTKEEKKNIVKNLTEKSKSTRQIADITGIPKSTVSRYIDQLSQMGQLKRPKKIEGKDGKIRPSTKKKSKPIHAVDTKQREATKEIITEAESGNEIAEKEIEKITNGTQTILGAKRKLEKKEKLEKAKNKKENDLKAEIDKNKAIVFHEDYKEFIERFDEYDLLLTDPPYITDVENIEEFVDNWLFVCLNKIKPTGSAYIFIGAYPKEVKAYLNAEIPSHLELKQILIWTYRNTLGRNPKDRYKLNYQNILFFKGDKSPDLNCKIKKDQWAVQDINAPDGRQANRYHKWQKPIEIAVNFIRHSTKENNLIVDPFCCTGTFVLAASKLDRKGYGCDINKNNLQIAIERGCQLNG